MGAEFAGNVSDYDNVLIVLWESATKYVYLWERICKNVSEYDNVLIVLPEMYPIMIMF